MSRSLCLKVDVIGGGHVEDTIQDIASLASRIGVAVEAKINAVTILAFPGDDPETLMKAWEKALNSNSEIKFASAGRAE